MSCLPLVAEPTDERMPRFGDGLRRDGLLRTGGSPQSQAGEAR